MWDGFTGDRLYLDSNIVILAVETGNQWTDMLRLLFEAIDRNEIRAVTSEMTIAEVLAKPLALGATDVIAQYEALFVENSQLETIEIDRAILRSAAGLQGRLGVKLIDAIHAATALEARCDFFVSNDIRLGRRLDVPRWLSLGDVASP
jgi:predicted nucleic acid-binding protein